jgi:sugar lactone lactonase YvrE
MDPEDDEAIIGEAISLIDNLRAHLGAQGNEQEVARMILEYLGQEVDEGEDHQRILNDFYAGLQRFNRQRNDMNLDKNDRVVNYDTKTKALVTVLSKEFEDPRGVVRVNGSLFVVDSGNKALIQLKDDNTREILMDKEHLKWPIGICNGLNQNEILVSDVTKNCIMSYNTESKEIKVFAGNGEEGKIDGNVKESQFHGPRGMFKQGDKIIVCDSNNNTLRLIDNSQVSDMMPGFKNVDFNLPTGLCLDREGNLIVCDCENHCIRRIRPNGVGEVIAGKPGSSGYIDGKAEDTLLNCPYSAVCIQGHLIFCEAYNNSVRLLRADGVVSTLVYNPSRMSIKADRQEVEPLPARPPGDKFNLGAPRGLFLDNPCELIMTESMASRVSRIVPIDWETTKWILTIQRNQNAMSEELLPELLMFIAILAYQTWRF